MSSAVTSVPGADLEPAAPTSKTILRQVLGDTFVRTGARLGAVWIGTLALLAVFAPFIANSHPILMKKDGAWSSPMLAHLLAADVTLLVVFAALIALLFVRRLRPKAKFLILLGVAAVSGAVTGATMEEPKAVVFQKYREMEAAGELERVYHTIIPYSPSDRGRDVTGVIHPQEPDARHWMGTEANGADVLSRIIHAARISLAIGFIATGIAVTIGIVIGGLMGYFVAAVDLLGMRLLEIIEAIPTLFLLLLFVAFWPEPSMYSMMVLIGLTTWTRYARFIRAEFLKLRKVDYVQAAIATGLPLRSVLFRHMLPNGVAPVLVGASFGVASAILFEAVLSFLGLGLVDEPSWGQLLNQATGAAGTFSWWLAMYPGMMIFLTVFAYNLVGEALRDAIDPHSKKSAQM